jgi:pilus assembly protein CpaB
MSKDGTLYTPDGKKATAADVLMAEQGLKPGKDGTVVDSKGHILYAKDLVTVDKNGTVLTKDGVVLKNVHVGKDGKLYDKNGHLVTAQDVLAGKAKEDTAKGILLSSATTGGQLATEKGTLQLSTTAIEQYEVEYIIGGSTSDGTAKTFMVNVDGMDENNTQGISNAKK